MRVTSLALIAALMGCALSREGLFETEGSGGQASAQSQSSVGVGGDATSTASTGSSGSENCLDGVDNDADGLIDCADDNCTTGFECVPEAPSGWQHHRVRTGAYGDAPAPCPDDSAPITTFYGVGGDAQCTDCACGPLQGVTCSDAQIRCYDTTNCSGSYAYYNASTTGCIGSTSSSYERCTMAQAPQPSGGSCAPSGGVATVPAPFASQNDACPITEVGAGCDSGEVCVPRARAPYDTPICIAQAGDVNACPGGWSNHTVAYETFGDDRGCAGCDCSLSGVACSGAQFTIYDLNGCASGGDGSTTVSDNTCVDVSLLLDNGFGSLRYDAPTPGGNCMPQGGGPVGSVAPDAPITYCCQ